MALGRWHRANTTCGFQLLGRMKSGVWRPISTCLHGRCRRTSLRWIADISHELRTPVSILQAEIEAARDGIRNVDDRLIKSLGDETARLSRLVEDLYQLARADIGTLEYVFERCPLDKIVADALDHFTERFKDAGLHYEHHLDAGITIKGDHRRLLQLFENILENCCRYVSSPGKVSIQLERVGESAEVRIDDSGPGVDVSFLEVLFEPLHRGERSRNRQFGGVWSWFGHLQADRRGPRRADHRCGVTLGRFTDFN